MTIRKSQVLSLLGILGATLVAYFPVYRAGYIWDDDAHVTRPELLSLHGLRRIWFELGATQQYYPVLHSAFWVEHHLWGTTAAGYHVLNVLLHGLAAVLAALVLRRLAVPGAAWAAALFALHPVNVESAAWISEQKNTLSAVFYFLAALGFLRWHAGRGWGAYALATLAFMAALLSKSVTATLPAALLVALAWRQGRLRWREDVAPLVPWLALGLGAGLFTAWVERTYVGAGLFDLNAAQRILLAGRNAWFYAGKLAWPTHLLFIYPRRAIDPAQLTSWLYPLAVAAVLVVLWLKRCRGSLAVVLCFLGTLLPALGFVNVYPFVFSYVADHFQYLASLALLILPAALLSGRRWGPGVGIALLLVLGALTWRQCRDYRDMETLFRATLRENPDAWLAHDNLGVVLAATGRTDEAIGHYREVIRLRPDYPEAYNNLGNALARQGRGLEALGEYRQAIAVRPSFAPAEYDWGNVLSDMGNLSGAAEHYRRALQLHPDYPEAEYRLGNTYANQGQMAQAMEHYATALRERPGYPEAEANLGLALAVTGHATDAVTHLEAAVKAEPQEAEFHAYLGVAYARAGRLSAAADEYRNSLRLHPQNPDVQAQLQEVLRAMGQP